MITDEMEEALRHAKVRFECLAEEFEGVDDTALWAMCSVDAEMMGKALATLGDSVVAPREATKEMLALIEKLRGHEFSPKKHPLVFIARERRMIESALRYFACTPGADDSVVPGWQPIETAPKDGTDVLLGSRPQMFEGKPIPARVTVGHWTSDDECQIDIGDCGGPCRCREHEYVDPYWMSWDGGFTAKNQATHWMPLPAAPGASLEDGQ